MRESFPRGTSPNPTLDALPPDRVHLVHEGMSIVVAVAKRTARRLGGRVPVDDFTSLGNFALTDIVRSWDPERSTFAAYATRKLGWVMLDGIRRETHGRWAAARATALMGSDRLGEAYGEAQPSEHDPPTTAEQDGVALASMLSGHAAALALGLLATAPDATDVETPEDKLQQMEGMHVAKALVATLPDRERTLIERHYFGGEQFDRVARDLGITKSWASRLHQRALLTLAIGMGERRPIDDDLTVPLP